MPEVRRCHTCHAILPENEYIRSGDLYFCPMKRARYGFSYHCFADWAFEVFPFTMAERMVRDIPTPNMEG